jgi:hypothetical protein
MSSPSFAGFPFAGFAFAARSSQIILGSRQPLPFYCVSALDHVTPALGLHPLAYVSRNGGWFAPAQGSVIELGFGWYECTGGTSDTEIVGPLLLDVPATGGADPVSVRFEVVSAAGICPLTVGSNRYPLTFLEILSADHITAAVGISPTVLLGKVGHAFAPPAGAVVEIGSDGIGGMPGRGRGWFKVGPNAADYDTPGPLLLHATGGTTDPTDDKWDCVGADIVGDDRLTLSLLAVKALLVNSGIGFTNSSCIVSLEDEPFSTPSPPSCWITPGADPFNQPLNLGGGRYSSLIEFPITIRVVIRRASDIESTDLSLLTNASRGAYPIVYKIVNALTEQFLYSITGAPLTVTGLKPMSIGNCRRYKTDKQLGVVPITFTADILLDLTVPDP